jgi:metal-responsive CopG/Arc/MetJ family transcriptional regulator
MAKKIAVSTPEPLFKEMERVRKREGRDRSAWVQEAIGERLRHRERKADVAAYVSEYERHPETAEERAIAKAGMKRAAEALVEDEREE